MHPHKSLIYEKEECLGSFIAEPVGPHKNATPMNEIRRPQSLGDAVFVSMWLLMRSVESVAFPATP